MAKVLMVGLTPPLEGGSERHIYEISSRIENVDVLTQKGSACKNRKELWFFQNAGFLRSISFFLSFFVYSLYLLVKPRKEYDIIHIHENILYFMAPILRLRYRVFITVHGIKGFRFYENKMFWLFFRTALGFANTIIAVSKEDEKELKKFFGDVIYLPNGVDTKLYDSIKSSVEYKLVFIGRIHEQKGVVHLLEAFDKLKDEDRRIRLEIVGKINDYAVEMQKKFPDKRIIWKGFMEKREDIVRELKSAYCIVLPSLWEGLPLTLFESIASGRPVIVSALPAIKTVVSNKEVLFVKPGNSRDLLDKMEKAINNKKLAENAGKLGLAKSKSFDWGKISSNLEKSYINSLK